MAAPLLVLTLCIAALPADGFMEFMLDRCVFNTSDLENVEFIRSYYFNKVEDVRFDSRVGVHEGYTAGGLKDAEAWNKDKAVLARMRAERERYCKQHTEIYYEFALKSSAEPYVRLYSESPSASKHTSMLVCSVYDFYPKRIKVSWLRDGQEVTSDVTSTEELADADWYYQVHSHLEYTPRSGEKITCVVEHVSLKTPLHMDWDPSLPESERNKIAIGASGLVLGLVLSLAGFIYYRRKAQGRILVPTTD